MSLRLMFVSRTGAHVCAAFVQELAVTVKLNRLHLHRDNDAFYCAMQGVIDRLEPVAACVALGSVDTR